MEYKAKCAYFLKKKWKKVRTFPAEREHFLLYLKTSGGKIGWREDDIY
jgi:hypothetical protein